MHWRLSHRADPEARAIANRHYNRQKVGSPQFVPPGRCLVLKTDAALWVSSWPFAAFVRHAWAGAWMCTAFRREGGAARSSDLIRDAVAATRHVWGAPPPLGLVTFINREKVRPTIVRGRPIYGWTWMRIGFREVGETKGGLLTFRLAPEDMPEAEAPLGSQAELWPCALRGEGER